MIYQKLSEAYGWTPQQINNLTLFQLAYYLGAITPEHGRLKFKSLAEAQQYLDQAAQQKRH